MTIGRIHAQYRLRRGQTGAKERLDELLRQVAGEALELALERSGAGSREIVCIRSLRAPVRLNLARPDSALIAEWSLQVAGRIVDAAASAGGKSGSEGAGSIVRYASRSHALVGMGAAIARERFELLWAWRQMGFWKSRSEAPSLTEAALEFAGVIMREPDGGLAILVSLARQGGLRPLLRPMTESWAWIGAEVLAAGGVSDGAEVFEAAGAYVSSAAEAQPDSDLPVGAIAVPGGASGPGQQRIARVLRESKASEILKACRGVQLSPAARKALALLGVLESDPALFRAGAQERMACVRAVDERVFGAVSGPIRRMRPAAEDSTWLDLPAGNDPVSAAHRDSVPLDSREAAAVGHTAEGRRGPAEEMPAPPSGASGRNSEDAPSGDLAEAAARASSTEFGGLLFLLHLVEALRLPEEALQSAEMEARNFAWFLHRLAMELETLKADDPAALAFCGLGPEADPPSLDQPPATAAEQAFVEEAAERIRKELERLLPDTARSARDRMRFVCRRHAEIVADPGWIEARFRMRDVSTEIRRAGLDLDPNYVPWLGAVVRFVYA